MGSGHGHWEVGQKQPKHHEPRRGNCADQELGYCFICYFMFLPEHTDSDSAHSGQHAGRPWCSSTSHTTSLAISTGCHPSMLQVSFILISRLNILLELNIAVFCLTHHLSDNLFFRACQSLFSTTTLFVFKAAFFILQTMTQTSHSSIYVLTCF